MQQINPQECILHIPHSSTNIPDLRYYINEIALRHEINLLTDWSTEKIFHVPDVAEVTAQFSRVFCDVERLSDDQEPMYTKGMGFYYTLTDSGDPLRKENVDYKHWVFENYYNPHHQRLTETVEMKLKKHKQVVIIDCHSFSSIPLRRELQQSPKRPDICLGTDDFHTPPWLIQYVKGHFQKYGYSVALNKPYSGTIVPLSLYRRDKQVLSIMIEINKKLYMNEDTFQIFDSSVQKLNTIVKKLLANL